MPNEKLAALAIKHGVDAEKFEQDWASGMNEKALMEKHQIGGEALTQLVRLGGLSIRQPANDPREKDAPARTRDDGDEVKGAILGAHSRIDTLAGTVQTLSSSQAWLESRILALESKQATS